MKTEELKQLHQDLLNEQQAMIAEFKAMKKQYHKKAQGMFKKLSKAVFEVCPQIKTIFWQQYIPSFNDGDPCTFTLEDINVSNATEEELREHGGPGYDTFYNHETFFVESPMRPNRFAEEKPHVESGLESYRSKYLLAVTAEQNEILNALNDFVASNPDLMEDLFGSNAQIVITRDGVSSEWYDCGY